MTDTTTVWTIISSCFAGLGAVFLAIGLLRRRMTRGWQRTQGIIVNKDGSVTGMANGYPTFQWADETGRTHRRTSMVRQSFPPRLGTTVPVMYDPQRPSRGVVDTAAQRGTIFTVVGVVLVAIGLVVVALGTYVTLSTAG